MSNGDRQGEKHFVNAAKAEMSNVATVASGTLQEPHLSGHATMAEKAWSTMTFLFTQKRYSLCVGRAV